MEEESVYQSVCMAGYAGLRKWLAGPKRCCIVNGGSGAVQLPAKYSGNLAVPSTCPLSVAKFVAILGPCQMGVLANQKC